MKDILVVLMVLTLAGIMFWTGMLAVNCELRHQGNQAQPSVSVIQAGSPVNIGDDEGRLEASRSTPDSVLVACKRDPGQPTVYSRGRRAVGTHIYSVADSSTSNGCNRNSTGTRLNQHWLEQGSLQSQVSNH